MKLGFIGAGNMATALVRGILDNGILTADHVLAADISPEARKTFKENTGITPTDKTADMADSVDALVIAVKPQLAKDAVCDIAEQCANSLVISIAAGIRLEKVCQWVGHKRVIRVMPNTPSQIRKGAAGFACAEEAREEDKGLVRNILEGVGIALELDEEQLDTVTALSGSGPAYVFEFTQALIEAGVNHGLPRETSIKLAIQTMAGASEMLSRSQGSPEELRSAVTSPGGTTEAGLKILDDNNFRQILQDVVGAAKNRSIELSK